MEAIVRKKDGQIIWINGAGYGYMKRDPGLFDVIPIPDQDIAGFLAQTEDGYHIKPGLTWPGPLKTYPSDSRELLIDQQTGKAIDNVVHPFAGIEEQIGILRAQIAEILVALGLEPMDEFAKLNAIAAEKIQEGQKKKEMLNDAKDS